MHLEVIHERGEVLMHARWLELFGPGFESASLRGSPNESCARSRPLFLHNTYILLRRTRRASGDIRICRSPLRTARSCVRGSNGSPRETPQGCLRVDRGSSWLYPAWLLRSATRERNPADFRDAIMGFRLSRALP